MRIDTLTFFNISLNGIRDNQSSIARLSEQIATGQRLLAPKDDPVSMTSVLDLTNRVAVRTQYTANQLRAGNSLKYEQVVLQEVRSTLNQARALIAGATSPNDQMTRNNHAQQLRGVFNHLMALANTRDPGGNYIFAGDMTNAATPPYLNAGGGGVNVPIDGVATSYGGNAAVRRMEVDTSRQLQVSDDLNSVFRAGGGARVDLLQTLDEAIVRLPLNPPDPSTTTQSDLDAYIATLDAALGNLSSIEYRVSGAQSELADVKKTTQGLLVLDQNALGDLTLVDQASAITELQARKVTLEAASQAFSLTSKLSLFNYLG